MMIPRVTYHVPYLLLLTYMLVIKSDKQEEYVVMMLSVESETRFVLMRSVKRLFTASEQNDRLLFSFTQIKKGGLHFCVQHLFGNNTRT